MFWADQVADEILKSKRYIPYWVDDMKTPSGRVHVGALRGVVVHDLVFKALKNKGANAKFTYVFENHDPMDDIPSYLPRGKYEKYLGMPLFKIPSPEPGFSDFASYHALEFKNVFNAMGCEPEIIWTKDLYTGGKMNPIIKEVLDKADKVRQVYKTLYDKDLPKNWYPFQLYCPNCGKVSTTIVTDWDGEKVAYECQVDKVKWTKGCGSKGEASPFSSKEGMTGKLPWKVEWPAKWKAIGITVEGAGKDHMSSGGSHDFAKLICENVIDYPVPYPITYEWLLVGGKKMSSSRGVGTSAKEMLQILPPQLNRFLMVRIKVNQQINFDPSDPQTIPALFDDYQRCAQAYFNHGDKDQARIFELSQVGKAEKPPYVRFSVLAQWVQMPNMEEEIIKNGLTDWAGYARVWVERFAPEKDKFSIQKDLPETTKKLSAAQKKLLYKIAAELNKKWVAEEFQTRIYDLGKELELSGNDTFAAIYLSLLGKNHGPKAAWLILSLDRKFVKERFNAV